MRIARRSLPVVLSLAVFLITGATSASALSVRPAPKVPAPATGNARQAVGPLGYRSTVGSARYLALKAAADAHARRSATSRRSATAPAVATKLSFQGVHDAGISPPDTTGAAGTNRFIEITNLRYAIYKKGGAAVKTGGVAALSGLARSCLTDPQVMWDPRGSRFYYEIMDTCTHRLGIGFSKNANPTGVDSFCRYIVDFGFGKALPDYPKLGDTAGFLMIGVNTFVGRNYTGSDLAWLSKPGRGKIRACPLGRSFKVGRVRELRATNGKRVNTHVPAAQVDPSKTGWVVATTNFTSPSQTSSRVSLFRATKNRKTGGLRLSRASSISVPLYGMPANAHQPGTTDRLDALDGRFRQAVAARDPARGGVAVWTAHAVAGGGGSEERWYEFNPNGRSIFQKGVVNDPTGDVFNGAISPDRIRRGKTTGFGDGMVFGFNTSSAAVPPAIQMVSKPGGGVQSAPTLVKQSTMRYSDFSCSHGLCRWGDYSGATPDPRGNTGGPSGSVWLANQWNVPPTGGPAAWRTWIWKAAP